MGKLAEENIYTKSNSVIFISVLDSLMKAVSHLQSMWAEVDIKGVMLRSMIDSLVSEAQTDIQVEHQADLLVSDYRRHTTHRPLMQRTTCSSLEDRKEYFAKRRKLDKCLSDKLDAAEDG